MSSINYDQQSVEQISSRIPEVRAFLREARIDRTRLLTFREAAAAASVNGDELMAQLEDRMRRQARRAARPAEVAHEAEQEFMLV